MGRPPSNGGPSFRFNPVEVGEMEAILQAHNYTVPSREILDALAQRFSNSTERSGKVEVSGKQVWNWFQNRRYALRAKAARTSVPGQVNVQAMPRDDQSVVRNVPQAPQMQVSQPQVSQPPPAPPNVVRSVPQVPQSLPAAPSAQNASRNVAENSLMEFEAKSARDGAWYDVASFLSHRSLESGDPEAMVRFAGFGEEEDEWVNIRRHVRQRSLPCESSECVAVLPGDLILCFQEGKEQALYFDAHVLDAQRRRHDVRGCRCRFLVRYDHDQSEEIVALRKICRRPETDHRLQQLHAMPVNMNQQRSAIDFQAGNTLKLNAADTAIQKQPKQEPTVALSSTTTSATPITVPHSTEFKLQTTSAAPTTIPRATESKLQTSSAAPTNVPRATESKLQTTSATATTNPHATESKLQTTSAAATTIPHTTESKLQTTFAAPTTIPPATESKLQTASAAPTTIPPATQSKLQTTSTAPTTIPNATESGLETTSAAPTTIPHATESKLETTTVSATTVPHATESKLETPSAAPTTIPHATESKLETTTVSATTVPHATESKLETTSAAPTNIPHATESKSETTSAAPTTIPHAAELEPTTVAATTIAHATESKLETTSAAPTTIPAMESKALDAGNVTAEANTMSSNTVTVSTAGGGGALPAPPQG